MLPHDPQLLVLSSDVHAAGLPQHTCPAEQQTPLQMLLPVAQHDPALHVPEQGLPHPPQFAALVWVSTQTPLQ